MLLILVVCMCNINDSLQYFYARYKRSSPLGNSSGGQTRVQQSLSLLVSLLGSCASLLPGFISSLVAFACIPLCTFQILPFLKKAGSLHLTNLVFCFFLLSSILSLNFCKINCLFYQQTFIEGLSAGHCVKVKRRIKQCLFPR